MHLTETVDQSQLFMKRVYKYLSKRKLVAAYQFEAIEKVRVSQVR